ncbi:MAG: hypothetical protein ACRDD8_16455 [Bacteroidales bacterium]
MMYGKCDVCGKDAILSRKYFYYGIQCECHSPEHFEIVEHCSECTPVAPSRTTISIPPSDHRKSEPCGSAILRNLHKFKEKIASRDLPISLKAINRLIESYEEFENCLSTEEGL